MGLFKTIQAAAMLNSAMGWSWLTSYSGGATQSVVGAVGGVRSGPYDSALGVPAESKQIETGWLLGGTGGREDYEVDLEKAKQDYEECVNKLYDNCQDWPKSKCMGLCVRYSEWQQGKCIEWQEEKNCRAEANYYPDGIMLDSKATDGAEQSYAALKKEEEDAKAIQSQEYVQRFYNVCIGTQATLCEELADMLQLRFMNSADGKKAGVIANFGRWYEYN